MKTRRQFLMEAGALTLGSMVFSSFDLSARKIKDPGIQLYTFRKEMLEDATGTLKRIAALGFKEVESAGSKKGNYYGLKPQEIKKIVSDLGMTLRSGHVHIDDQWEHTVEEAVQSGQEYIICSVLPSKGQTVDNYKKMAELFNKTGEDCNKSNLKFGYHNHDYEFEEENGKVLYDVLIENTDPNLVHLELDLGWVIATGKSLFDYFDRYPGRFPLWHLKDMDLQKKRSTEFGKGGIDISKIFNNAKQSGMKYFFIEQEEYANNAWDSVKEDMDYLKKLK